MHRYQPITGIDCTPAALLIDTQAPLDVLHENAAQRIRTVTQLLAITLRDGCDLLDVIGRRLSASPTL